MPGAAVAVAVDYREMEKVVLPYGRAGNNEESSCEFVVRPEAGTIERLVSVQKTGRDNYGSILRREQVSP
jgi:hypothetical protein